MNECDDEPLALGDLESSLLRGVYDWVVWYGMVCMTRLNYGCRCRCCRSGLFLVLALLAMKVFIFSESVSASRLPKLHCPRQTRCRALEDLPLAGICNNSSTFIKWKGDTQDPCSRLPIERLMDVLFFLPTTSGQAVRLAFRAVASVSLNSSFWRSIFDFTNKFCHIRLPQRLQTRARADDLAVDWSILCYRLHR